MIGNSEIIRSLFAKRATFKPYEYPEFIYYKDAIRHAYWLHTEFNYDSDVQNYKEDCTDLEREQIKRAMLAIAQIEVNVKRFWADLYHMFPKPEVDMVGATFSDSECFDSDTEILTTKGWIKFPDLVENHKGLKVAQIDIDTKEVSFVVPDEYIAKSYTGKMHQYNSVYLDAMVTPNHRMYFENCHTGKVSIGTSDIFKSKRNYLFLSSYKGVGDYPSELTTLQKVLVAVQADGTVFGMCKTVPTSTRLGIYVKKPRKIKYVEELLTKLKAEYNIDWNYSVSKDKGTHQYTFSLGKELMNTIGASNIKNFGWIDIERVNPQWAKSFIKELSYWDCSIIDNSIAYYNANVEAVDKVQAVCVLGEHRCTIGINRTAEQSMKLLNPDGKQRQSAKTVYRLGIKRTTKSTYNDDVLVDYDGMVYCVAVPKGYIITRRNGKVLCSHNSRHIDAYANLLELLGFNEEFTRIHEYPALQARTDYTTEFLFDKNSTDRRKVMSTVLFSMFIEHISLFSQFLFIMSFNKNGNLFKGMSNAIEATSKEEEIHGNFGVAIYNVLRKENPEIFTQDFFDELNAMADKAFKAEMDIVDWIYADGDNQYISKETVHNYLKFRYNRAFKNLGLEPKFEVSDELYKSVEWFDLNLNASVENDFFYKRSTDYSKRTKSITEDDLF